MNKMDTMKIEELLVFFPMHGGMKERKIFQYMVNTGSSQSFLGYHTMGKIGKTINWIMVPCDTLYVNFTTKEKV